MTLKPLTERLEDYLEVIAELIAVDDHAYSKEIAEGLSVKIPSVSGMLRSFENAGRQKEICVSAVHRQNKPDQSNHLINLRNKETHKKIR